MIDNVAAKMHRYKSETESHTLMVRFVTVRWENQESALLKWRQRHRVWFFISPSPLEFLSFTPIFPPVSLPASGPADVTVPFPYFSPPPALFQGQTPLHHYTGMDNSDGGVWAQGEAGAGGSGLAGVELADKRESDNIKWILCSSKWGISRFDSNVN